MMVLPLEKAQALLLAAARVLPWEEVPLGDCWQRVLAEELAAGTDFPPFDRSPLDGYALVAAEAEGAGPGSPVWLDVVEEIPAGHMPGCEVAPGQAARIMTGAPVPRGATGVVRLEDCREDGRRVAVLAGKGAAGNVCRRGEEIATGERLVPAGTVINAGVMGLLALMGVARPRVFRRPRVALLATGSEVVEVDAALVPGAIRNSNSYMLAAQVFEAGGQPQLLGIAGDDTGAIAARLAAAAACDLVVTTGGVSAGDYDLLADVYKEMNVTVIFDRVGIKPGMPVLAGHRDGRLYVGLSGNPAAAAVAFEHLVRPLLLKMGGRRGLWRPRARARLTAPFDKGSDATRFVWARCASAGRELAVAPLPLQGNGMLKSAAAANALIVIPAGSPPLAAGAEVEIVVLADL